MGRRPEVYLVSTYPPRRCGLATFAYDLVAAVASGRGEALHEGCSVGVIAMSERTRRRHYAPEVRRVIRASRRNEYAAAADFVNDSPARVVSLQHEYGIFGGRAGRYVLTFLDRLARPAVVTLHTVMAKPKAVRRDVLRAVCEASAMTVVQARKAAELLKGVYGVPPEKVSVIPHGTPDVPFASSESFKEAIDATGRPVLLTFGLLHARKGIDVAIRAMSEITRRFPDALYVVLGATHPVVKARYGESYRSSLRALTDRLGLRDNVRFVKRYVGLPGLLTYVRAADIYVTPYLDLEQTSSGTLAYAVACGRAAISTPYWFAQELLADGRGILVDFRDWRTLASKAAGLLAEDDVRLAIARRAYRYGRGTTWAKAAVSYEKLFRKAAAAARR